MPVRRRTTLPSPKYTEITDEPMISRMSNNPLAKSYTPVLVVLLIVAAYLLGMLTTKIQYMEKNGSSQPAAVNPSAAPNQPAAAAPVKPLHVSQSIGMDVDKFKTCLNSGKYTAKVASDLADGQKATVNGTPAIFINGQLIVGAQPYSAFQTVIDQELANPGVPLPTGTRYTVDPGSFPPLGQDNAPVTIIEFADFQCPFCERFYSGAEKQIIETYVKTGKAKLYFRNYAFLGPESNVTAEGAYCANEQGKFWDYHNFLYTHQGQENSGQFSKQNLL